MTVSRRLQRLETSTGQVLLARRRGAYVLTQQGEALASTVSAIEEQMNGISRAWFDEREEIAGPVRLTCVEMLSTHFIAPRLPEFHLKHPRVAIELVVDWRNLSLARREADIALRLAKPNTGDVIATHLCDLLFHFYQRKDLGKQGKRARPRLIGYVESGYPIPEADHARQFLSHFGPFAFQTNHVTTRLAAIVAGAGAGLIPQFLGDAQPELERIEFKGARFAREVWLLIHKDLRRVPRVRACREALLEWFEAARPELSGD